jgi:hypothetical protein
MNKKVVLDNKGQQAEELLRSYFLLSGYYVVRGVPFTYDGFDVTDIDLWLYARTSSVSREIAIVDIKNKKTPQAIERIFWVQGLKQAINATRAIVATTEKRKAVKDFGRELGVTVLDGSFLSKLTITLKESHQERLSDEEFFDCIKDYELEKIDGEWKKRVFESKSLLAKGLSFDNCNALLLQAHFFATQVIIKSRQKDLALRCLYLICSFISITLDFIVKEISFLDESERIELLKEGFTYGSKGRVGTERLLDLSLKLIEQYSNNTGISSSQIRHNLQVQIASIDTDILGEFFSKSSTMKSLFQVAKEFEEISMCRVFEDHLTASTELKSMLLCLLDYWGIDRVQFLNCLKND